MQDQPDFSFGILRLLLFTAAVGAAFGVARVLPEAVFAPVLMSGIAASLIVLVAKRRDLRRIASLVFAAFVGLLSFVALACLGYEFAGIAVLVALIIVVFVHARLRGAD